MADRSETRISPARLALAVKKLRADQESLALLDSEPIAVVGMACRFPGKSDSPAAYWQMLAEGRSGIVDLPAGRWPGAEALPAHIRRGGFLDAIDGFDAAYFGISPREAQQIDPQQRLLLEVVWEALWDAGIEPDGLADSDTGVYVAVYNHDYARLLHRLPSGATAHAAFGNAHGVAAGRISFLLDLKGPSLAVDTGCSASLVAAHVAVQALRARECGMAIVGGSSLKALPDEVLVFADWGMLASDGRCKTFDAAADGFASGEGAGVLLLKRLADALEAGDRVRAVIRGSAVNQDGRSTVLTAPNGLAQEAVLRAALANARVDAEEVTFVEAHGTGTALGDPIELEALDAVYGRIPRRDGNGPARPCVVGAVKSNFGHLEAAAGVAGLIKTVLSLEHGLIPRNLHFHTLNPQFDPTGSRLLIAAENVPWVGGSYPRIAGVSGFGVGGTNAHILLEEAPRLPAGYAPARTIPLPARVWQRQRYWLAEGQTAPPQKRNHSGEVHPFLGRGLTSAFVDGRLFPAEIGTDALPWLRDHALGSRPLLPFAALLEIVAAAAAQPGGHDAVSFRGLTLREPFFVPAAPRRLEVRVSEKEVEVAGERGDGWVRLVRAERMAGIAAPAPAIDLDALRARCRRMSGEEFYGSLEAGGLRFGPSFRVVTEVWQGRGESVVRVRLPEQLEDSRYGIHPALLDGCLQAVSAARVSTHSDLFLPIAVDGFHRFRRAGSALLVHCRVAEEDAESLTASLVAYDENGTPVLALEGFHAKRASASALMGTVDPASAYELAWRPAPLAAAPSRGRQGEQWLLVEGKAGGLSEAARALTGCGAICTVVPLDEAVPLAGTGWTAVVCDLRDLHATMDRVEWSDPERPGIDFLFAFARALAASEEGSAPRLWLLTAQAVAVVAGESPELAQAPLTGMLRTLAAEHRSCRPVLLDADAASPLDAGDAWLLDELGADEDNAAIAWRNGRRYVARLAPWKPRAAAAARRLAMAVPGRLSDLGFAPAERQEPAAGEVEIEVRAHGLNFRDVLNALGVFGNRDLRFGGECAGVVTAVGAGVTEFCPGDAVLAFAPRSMQSFVTMPVPYLARMPRGWSFAGAASVPVAFLTAWYGLHTLAGLRAGQRVLIHAAAGGLGQAAVQIAQAAGAEVLATAGSEEKRAWLRAQGVRHVFDSRSLSFRDAVLAATGDAGVDVVLNSLADDFIRAGLETVAKGGCFLEVGKRGIWTKAEVEAFRPEIRYFVFDLGEVGRERPAQIEEIFRPLMAAFASGTLRPLRTTLFAFDDAAQAFRTMAQAGHVGKIVLTEAPAGARSLRERIGTGTVLVTGGLGALGVETARWLADHGARRLVLAGRHADARHPVMMELRERGVDVTAEAVDVASGEEVAALLSRIRTTGSPLTAIVHAAGALHDATLMNESWPNYAEATAAKIAGAWNLHRLTQADPVALTVFFSSAAALLGQPGQGSYAAGNAFLDALAQIRSSAGLPTLSVNWGAWGGDGMAERLAPEHRARMERQGIRPMEPACALRAMELAIEAEHPQMAVMEVDWAAWMAGRSAADAAVVRDMADRSTLSASPAPAANALAEILGAPRVEREERLARHVKACARRVLSLQEDTAIDDTVPLQDVGLDSLMALEMRNEIGQSLGLALPAGLLFNFPTVAGLAAHLRTLLPEPAAEEAATAPQPAAAEDALAELQAMSDDEAERLLLEELEAAEGSAHV